MCLCSESGRTVSRSGGVRRIAAGGSRRRVRATNQFMNLSTFLWRNDGDQRDGTTTGRTAPLEQRGTVIGYLRPLSYDNIEDCEMCMIDAIKDSMEETLESYGDENVYAFISSIPQQLLMETQIDVFIEDLYRHIQANPSLQNRGSEELVDEIEMVVEDAYKTFMETWIRFELTDSALARTHGVIRSGVENHQSDSETILASTDHLFALMDEFNC